MLKITYSAGLSPSDAGKSRTKIDSDQNLPVLVKFHICKVIICLIHVDIRGGHSIVYERGWIVREIFFELVALSWSLYTC